MKAKILIIGPLLLLVVIFVNWRMLSQDIRSWQASANELANKGRQQNPEDIPLYPGGEKSKAVDDHRPSRHSISFDAQTGSEDVLAFYRTVLPRLGWKIVGDNSTGKAGGQGYQWLEDDGEKRPAHYELSVTAMEAGAGSVPGGRTHVVLDVTRWPNINNVPLYPSASNRRVQRTKDEYGFDQDVVTYEATGSPSQIEQFYQGKLPRDGWTRSLEEGATIESGIFFVFSMGSPEVGKTFGTLKVYATPNSAGDVGRTTVTMEIAGSELP